jgi:peroxiredoxin (alkyl hydroperoxide reductase subunit C)
MRNPGLVAAFLAIWGCSSTPSSQNPGNHGDRASSAFVAPPVSLIGNKAPDFSAKAAMPDDSIADISLSEFRGKYVLLFFYPGDFTFVCPTEIIAFDGQLDQFRAKDCEIIGASVDSEHTHLAWRRTPVKEGGIGAIRYPLVADITKSISESYGVLHEGAVALRGWFLIDRKGVTRHVMINDLPLGRNTEEAMRLLDALRFVDEHPDVCPANWHSGDETLEPSAEGVEEYLSKHK